MLALVIAESEAEAEADANADAETEEDAKETDAVGLTDAVTCKLCARRAVPPELSDLIQIEIRVGTRARTTSRTARAGRRSGSNSSSRPFRPEPQAGRSCLSLSNSQHRSLSSLTMRGEKGALPAGTLTSQGADPDWFVAGKVSSGVVPTEPSCRTGKTGIQRV